MRGEMESVRRIRKERGWSQERTAAEAGIDRVTLVHIETGRSSPTVETLQKPARAPRGGGGGIRPSEAGGSAPAVETLQRLAGALGVEVADFFPRAQGTLFAPDDSPAGRDAGAPAGGGARGRGGAPEAV